MVVKAPKQYAIMRYIGGPPSGTRQNRLRQAAARAARLGEAPA